MSVIELQSTYDITGPLSVPDDSLCKSCKIKGKSFLCLIIKKSQYPIVKTCDEYEACDEE
jgi:hypothetical protein